MRPPVPSPSPIPPVSELAEERQALLDHRPGALEVAEGLAHGGRDEEELRPGAGGQARLPRQRLLHPAAPLAYVPAQPPERPHRIGRPRYRLRLPVLQRPPDRSAQVVELGLQPPEPGSLFRSPQLRPDPLRQRQVVPGVPSPHLPGLAALL